MPQTPLLINPCITWSCFALWTCTSHPYNNDARTLAFTTLPFIFFAGLSFKSLARTARHNFLAFLCRSQRSLSFEPSADTQEPNTSIADDQLTVVSTLLVVVARFQMFFNVFPDLYFFFLICLIPFLSFSIFLCGRFLCFFCLLDFSLLVRRCCHLFPRVNHSSKAVRGLCLHRLRSKRGRCGGCSSYHTPFSLSFHTNREWDGSSLRPKLSLTPTPFRLHGRNLPYQRAFEILLEPCSATC